MVIEVVGDKEVEDKVKIQASKIWEESLLSYFADKVANELIEKNEMVVINE